MPSPNQLVFQKQAKAMKDKDPLGREGAATALGILKVQQAIPVLEAALKDPDARVRWSVAGALKKIKNKK